jgi:hypothetical protein
MRDTSLSKVVTALTPLLASCAGQRQRNSFVRLDWAGLGWRLETTGQGHGSKLEGHGSKLEGHGSKLEGHGSKLEGHGSKLEGHGSIEQLDRLVARKVAPRGPAA